MIVFLYQQSACYQNADLNAIDHSRIKYHEHDITFLKHPLEQCKENDWEIMSTLAYTKGRMHAEHEAFAFCQLLEVRTEKLVIEHN